MSRESLAKAREKRMANIAAQKAEQPAPVFAGVPRNNASQSKNELDKVYHFQLAMDYPEAWFPVDKKTGKLNKAPFPRHYVIPNSGIAWCEETGRARKWRYIEGQSSIWEDEQELDNFDPNQIQEMLGQDENQIEFVYGQLHVRGIEKLKLQALMVQDKFEGKERQYQPKNREYRLLNPEKQLEKEMNILDKQFMAEKLARECSTDKIIECAFVMGIDITDLSDAGIARIRYEFIKKSKYDPQNPKGLGWFMDIVNSPLTHARYTFSAALGEGLLSTSQQAGKLTWAASNAVIMDVNPAKDIVDQLVVAWNGRDELVVRLLKEIETKLFEAV